jgi:hypothetical protein
MFPQALNSILVTSEENLAPVNRSTSVAVKLPEGKDSYNGVFQGIKSVCSEEKGNPWHPKSL